MIDVLNLYECRLGKNGVYEIVLQDREAELGRLLFCWNLSIIYTLLASSKVNIRI